MGNRIHTEVIAHWRLCGVEAEVLSLDARLRAPSRREEEGVVVHRLPAAANLPLRVANRLVAALLPYPFLAGAAWHYRQFIRQHSFDLVHIETAFPLAATALLGPAQPPLAVTLPGADIMSEPEFDYGYGRFASVRRLLKQVFARALTIRADSPMIEQLAIQLGAQPSKLTAIPYNITVESFPPVDQPLAEVRARARQTLIERHALDPHRPILVSVNRLHPFKGIAYVVEALAPLKARGLRPQFVVVGPNRQTPHFGDYGAYLRQRAEALGVSDQVHLVGGVAQPEARTYLAAADLATVTSVAESFSRVAIEACAVGTPVAITKTTGASFYIAQAHAGVVVEPRSGTALAEGIAGLLSDPTAWAAASQHAAALAPAFRSSAIADQLLALYRAALAGSHAHHPPQLP